MGRAVLVCACDRDGLCPACAEREAAEWEPDPRDVAEAEAHRRGTVSAPEHECPLTILGGFVIAAAWFAVWFAVGLLFGMFL